MPEQTLQERLIAEFFDTRWFGDPHDFAARAEILRLRARVEELESKHGKAEKGSTAATKTGKSEAGE